MNKIRIIKSDLSWLNIKLNETIEQENRNWYKVKQIIQLNWKYNGYVLLVIFEKNI